MNENQLFQLLSSPGTVNHSTFRGVVPRKTESSETSAPCGSEEIYAVPVSGEMAWVGVVESVGDATKETKTPGGLSAAHKDIRLRGFMAGMSDREVLYNVDLLSTDEE